MTLLPGDQTGRPPLFIHRSQGGSQAVLGHLPHVLDTKSKTTNVYSECAALPTGALLFLASFLVNNSPNSGGSGNLHQVIPQSCSIITPYRSRALPVPLHQRCHKNIHLQSLEKCLRFEFAFASQCLVWRCRVSPNDGRGRHTHGRPDGGEGRRCWTREERGKRPYTQLKGCKKEPSSLWGAQNRA